MANAFYVRQGDGSFLSTPSTVGPWDPTLQHGGPPAALLGAAIESETPKDHARVAQFSLDFLGPVPVAPLRVSTEIVRPGKKIELLSATASVEGRALLRATAWRLSSRPGTNPEKNLEEASPELPAIAANEFFESVATFGYGEALEWRFAQGGFRELGPSTVWSRLRVSVIDGAAPSPLTRALAMVDSANGISAELDVRDYLFVPVNVTVSFTREPEGEWMGMRATTRLARDGIGTTGARLFDQNGFFGEALQTLYVETRSAKR